MSRIFKYQLKVTDSQRIMLPYGSKVLSVENQKETIVMYAIVDEEQEHMANIGVRIAGTGHKIEQHIIMDYRFLGTVKMLNGDLMFHVFVEE
jgi:hypothetical protein